MYLRTSKNEYYLKLLDDKKIYFEQNTSFAFNNDDTFLLVTATSSCFISVIDIAKKQILMV